MPTKKSDPTLKKQPSTTRKKKTEDPAPSKIKETIPTTPVPLIAANSVDTEEPNASASALNTNASASASSTGVASTSPTASSESTLPATPNTAAQADHPQKKKEEPIPQREERFDLNTVTLSGTIRSVWGGGDDVFARLGLSTRGLLVEDEDKFTAYVTLRFAEGMVSGQPLTIQKGDVVRVRGYLTHREYSESLRKFLDDAHASSFFDLVPADDLSSWRNLEFKRVNGVMNVLGMMALDLQGKLLERFGFEEDDRHDSFASENNARMEGLVSRIWEYPRDNDVDVFARLAVYDAHTPVSSKRAGNFGRERRLAHYITVRFPCGKTSSGSTVRLKQKMRIRVIGELHDKMRTVTLRDELLGIGNSTVVEMMQRVQNADHMNEIKNQQESLHVLANAVIVYSFGGGSR